jgi:lipoyl(octanoyl) transferase
MRVVDLGVIGYPEAEALQLARVAEVTDGAEETLFLLEHTPVVTVGRNADLTHLLVPPEALASRGALLARAARGGDITCHFPGQLVAYPIFRLERRPGGLRSFFSDLEEAIIRTLARFEVSAGRVDGRPGVWLGTRKIASIGVAVRRWVSYHGLALNVGPDLRLFSQITLCGLADASPTSLALELAAKGLPVPETATLISEVKDVLVQEFLRLYAPAELAAREAARG